MTDDPEERLQALFQAHYAAVLAYACRRTPDRMLAEEAAAEVFVTAWRRLDAVPEDALAWLLAIARRTLANYRRAAGRRDRLVARIAVGGSAPDSVDAADVLAERDAFTRAFASLRALDREILALVAWEGLDRDQAARAMECSTAAFAVRLHRARRRLRRQLDATAPRRDATGPPEGDAALDGLKG